MKKICFCFVCIVQFYSFVAQTKDSSFYYLNLKCDYTNAIRCYEKKLSNLDGYDPVDLSVDYFNLACAIARCNDKKNVKKSISYLEKSFVAAKSTMSILFGEADFYSYLNLPEWRSFVIDLKKRVVKNSSPGIFGKVSNDSIFYSLYKASVQDQALYAQLNCYERLLGKESSEVKNVWKIKDSLNSLNENFLNNSFNNGINLLASSEVGAFFSNKMFLIVQHSDTTMMAKYLPVVKELYLNKEIRGENYALLFDRLMVNREKGRQYYGTQINPKNNKPYPIKDVKNVNKRRSQLGMISLESYIEQF